MNRITKLTIITLTASILSAGTAFAAPVVPDISDAVKQTTPAIEKEKKESEIPVIQQPEQKVQKLDNGARIFVKQFKITGNKHISTEEILPIINKSENINKEYSMDELNKIASVVTKHYRGKGFFVTRAFFAKQDVVDSTLELTVLEGYYGDFKLKNRSLVKDGVVQGMLDDIKDKNIISTNTIERAMLIINDTPGAVVTQADVMPGTTLGTSDFMISTEATNRYSGYAVYDNYGSRYSGENRFMAGMDINSPFGLGDKLSVSGMTTDSIGITNGRVAYAMPLMSNGTRGEVAYTRTNYELGREYNSLDAHGTSDAVDFSASYPFIRTRQENLKAIADLSFKKNIDELDTFDTETRKKLVSAGLGINYSKNYVVFGISNSTDVTGNITIGNVSFDDSAAEAQDDAGADTAGVYSKLYAELTQKTSFTKELSLTVKLKAQHSLNDKNLDGSEDMSVGGSGGVRLYPSGELSAENGYIMNIETSYALPALYNVSNKVGLFYDIASASMENKVGSQPERTLQDAGFGYYASYKNFFLKAEYAFLLGADRVESEPEYKQQLLIQSGMSF